MCYTTSFAYDSENKPTTITYGTGSLTYTWDKLNRITKRRAKPGTTNIDTTYTYYGGGHGTNSTTNLIKTIVQSGITLTYTYDDNGNITKVSDGTKQTQYYYDAIGQLTRVNDQFDTRSSASGTTWVYTYDLGGNITTRKRYAYVAGTGTLGTVESTATWTYGNSNWKDQLTAYGSAAITYDNSGNPLSDGTYTYTWAQGRQLQSITKSDGSTYTFEYNEDGLRTKLTTPTVTAEYIWHGDRIVHMTRGSYAFHFYYDAQGRPSEVIYKGNPYSYQYNLQGDVIAIVDKDGTRVVEYTYDSWGKPLSRTGSLKNTLGYLQPFRYRGYIYDLDTGLYYLRSRYYSPDKCRFINADALVKGNLYCYCENIPIAYKDESGNKPKLNHLSLDSSGRGGSFDNYDDYIDITIQLDSEMKEHYSELLRVFLNGGWGEAVCFFLINVKTGGAWDLKSSKEWDLKKNKKYLYHDIVLRFDEPGNIHYGYVGSAIFSLPVLLSGAGLYQILSNTSKICYISSYFDDPLDSAAIKYGYLLKHEIYSTVFYFDSLSTYEKYYKGLER